MGKYLLIKNADFSENAVEQVVLKRYFYNIPDSVMNDAATAWVMSATGYAQGEYDRMEGKTIVGMRLNVRTAGTVTIYKATGPILDLKSLSDLTQVATATTTKTGIQDINFSTPITLGTNECIIIGNANDTLIGYFHSASTPLEIPFYIFIGQSTVKTGVAGASLDIDFYEIVNP